MSKLQAVHKSLSEAQYIPQIGFGQKGKRKLFLFHTFFSLLFWNPHYEKIRKILSLIKMCERSEIGDLSQLFYSVSQTRHLTVELSQLDFLEPLLHFKALKMYPRAHHRS